MVRSCDNSVLNLLRNSQAFLKQMHHFIFLSTVDEDSHIFTVE